MTVEQQVDALATSVDQLKAAVATKKATLDASVVDAQSATAQAQAAKANALSARDQAGSFKDAAYTAAQSAASAVAYQDLTALAAEKAVTAVDVFIYDTSKDSDGGAWRHRCAGTSWFNEPLNTAARGARREFPAVAVIVAESQTVTIYDGDDPTLPMWMVFTPSAAAATPQIWRGGRSATSLRALNGIVCLGVGTDGQGGVVLMDLLADSMSRYSSDTHTGGIPVSRRNEAVTTPVLSSQRILNAIVNDVAMTVLTDAPISTTTVLPVPTIALACGQSGQPNGGLSIIHNDGLIVDLLATSGAGGYACFAVDFSDDGRLIVSHSWSGGQHASLIVLDALPRADINNPFGAPSNWGGRVYNVASFPRLAPTASSSDFYVRRLGASDGKVALLRGFQDTRFGGITLLSETPNQQANGMAAMIHKDFTSGWLPGAIRGAFLADTDDTDLVGAQLLANGSFESDLSSWTVNQATAWVSGAMRLESDGNPDPNSYSEIISVRPGAIYEIEMLLSNPDIVSRQTYIRLSTTGTPAGAINPYIGGMGQAVAAGATVTRKTLTQVPAGVTSVRVSTSLSVAAGQAGARIDVRDVAVREVVADRSVGNGSLTINGTITRAPVATGAELVAYSGFSGDNFLEQPYNAALDFGTGDFCVMGWMFMPSVVTSVPFSKGPVGGNPPPYFEVQVAGGEVRWVGTAGAGAKAFGPAVAGRWAHVCYTRNAGVGRAYMNGVLNETEADTSNYNHSGTDVLRFGLRQDNFGAFNGSLALWRISATVPTADQIRRIYDDEKPLFQENAACTLYGASDVVTALAHDPDTGLLHVGTSAGRSVFKGLRRVANTTVPVGAAIAAAGGMVVDE